MSQNNAPETVSERIERARKRTGRLLAIVCSAAVLAVSLPMASLSAGAADTAISAKTTFSLNLRKGAGTNYGVVTIMDKDTVVTVVDKSNKDWIKVRLSNGTTGYCSASYLDITTDAKTVTAVNMRKGAGTSYAVIKTLASGTMLDILSFSGNSWAYVKLSDGTKGYVCTDYISYIGTSSSGRTNTGTAQTVQFSMTLTSKKMALGSVFQIKATPSTGSFLTWSSDNEKVARVGNDGSVKALAEGTANIKVVDKLTKKSAVCKITVIKTDVLSIKLSKSSANLKIGDTLTLNPTVVPSNGKVYYTTSDKSVATVSDKGVVKAVAPGTATVNVADSTRVVNASIKVTVKEPTKVTMTQSYATTTSGSSVTLNAFTNDGSAINWTSSDESVAAVTNGVVSAFRSGTVTITASDSTGKSKAACTVKVNPVTTSGISMSRYSATTTAGKTIYIRGYSNYYSTYWGSSDTSIADVSNGLILTKKAGKVAITFTAPNGNREICVVTVKEAAPIRFTYTSPNSAVMNSTVKLIAITDKNRTSVRFKINNGSSYDYVTANEKYLDGNTYVWKASYKVRYAGTFSYEAQAYSNGSWKTCDDGKDSIYVSSKTNVTTTSLDRLRASDGLIDFIADKEGFVSTVYYDSIANYLPTLGHGIVIWEGDQFYNNLTRNEAYAMLVDSINGSAFTNKVNNMLINNNVRFNQQQFDALVSFSYNLGPAWTTNSSSRLRQILLDSYGTISGTTVTGTVSAAGGLNLRSASTTNSSVVKVLSNGERVTLLGTEKYNGVWYKVKTSDGKIGYCSGTYLRLSTGSSVGRDLNYVNKNAFIKEMLSFHHSCGICYYGLLYRRADEVEMFLYGDYRSDGRNNKYNLPDPGCISFP